MDKLSIRSPLIPLAYNELYGCGTLDKRLLHSGSSRSVLAAYHINGQVCSWIFHGDCGVSLRTAEMHNLSIYDGLVCRPPEVSGGALSFTGVRFAVELVRVPLARNAPVDAGHRTAPIKPCGHPEGK